MNWFRDRAEDVGGFVEDRVDDAKDFAGDVVGGPAEFFNKAMTFGLPSGNDGGSSAWDNWGHADIRSMLDNSVSVQNIDEYERAWQEKSQQIAELVSNRVRSITSIVAEGWQGESAAAAIASLGPIEQWSAQLVRETSTAGQFIKQAGTSAETADRMVPPAPEISTSGGLLRGIVSGSPIGMAINGFDMVQGNAEAKAAHGQAVAIMKGSYSGGINPAKSSLPADFTPGPDPTLQAPNPSLTGGGGGGGGGAGGFGGAGVNPGAFTPPAVQTTAQGFTPSEYRSPSGVPVNPAAAGTADPSTVGRGGTPVSPAAFSPGAGVGAGGGGGVRGGGAGVRGGGTGRAGGMPRGAPTAPGTGSGGAGGTGAGARGAGAGGRGGMPMGGMGGGGRGRGEDDLEHKNRFLVEEDDDEVNPIVGKLPPALPAGGVIGEAPWQREQREKR